MPKTRVRKSPQEHTNWLLANAIADGTELYSSCKKSYLLLQRILAETITAVKELETAMNNVNKRQKQRQRRRK